LCCAFTRLRRAVSKVCCDAKLLGREVLLTVEFAIVIGHIVLRLLGLRLHVSVVCLERVSDRADDTCASARSSASRNEIVRRKRTSPAATVIVPDVDLLDDAGNVGRDADLIGPRHSRRPSTSRGRGHVPIGAGDQGKRQQRKQRRDASHRRRAGCGPLRAPRVAPAAPAEAARAALAAAAPAALVAAAPAAPVETAAPACCPQVSRRRPGVGRLGTHRNIVPSAGYRLPGAWNVAPRYLRPAQMKTLHLLQFSIEKFS